MQQSDCAPSEDSNQPRHQPSLIRVFAVRMKKAWVLSYPLSAQRRLWSDWVDAQADLSLRWAHSHFISFVMRRLIFAPFSCRKVYREFPSNTLILEHTFLLGVLLLRKCNEPTHEIMALIALRKRNRQTRMRSNPLALYVWFLVRPFVYFHTLCVRIAKALASLAWAFAIRLCDKYCNLTSWLKCSIA